MANNDNATGFSPVKFLDGTPYAGQARKYLVSATDATAVYIGDPVKLGGSSDSRGIATVVRASTGDAVVGVMVGRADATRDSVLYREASTAQYILCSPVRDLLYECQEDSTGNALAASAVGSNISFAGTGGDTTYGTSNVELDSDSAANTSTLACQIIELANRDDNEIGTNAKWLVRFNDVQFANQIAGTTE